MPTFINNKRCLPPSAAVKIRKESSKKYLMFGPNRILVTLRWDDGRYPGHENENVFWLFLN